MRAGRAVSEVRAGRTGESAESTREESAEAQRTAFLGDTRMPSGARQAIEVNEEAGGNHRAERPMED